MKSRKRSWSCCWLSLSVFAVFAMIGCGNDGGAPVATDVSDVQSYLDANPELKEPKPEVDNTILTGEG